MNKEDRKVHQKCVKYRFEALQKGAVYSNTRTSVFKLFGYFWVSNKNRKTMYKMDDWYWHKSKASLWFKVTQIVLRKVKGFRDV